jgi:hypothetical protein
VPEKVVTTLKDQRLRLLENKFIMRIFVPKRDEGKE